jgi:hypothetical protein
MTNAEFLLAVRVAAGHPRPLSDPLAVAERFLAEAGETAEGQILRRLILAIAFDWGSFQPNDMFLLSLDTRQLVSALCEARLACQYSPMQWAASSFS